MYSMSVLYVINVSLWYAHMHVSSALLARAKFSPSSLIAIQKCDKIGPLLLTVNHTAIIALNPSTDKYSGILSGDWFNSRVKSNQLITEIYKDTMKRTDTMLQVRK